MLGDQVADAGVQQRGGAAAPLDVVVLGPGGDRHRAERMTRYDRALSLGHARGQDRLEVLAEALERVVSAAAGSLLPWPRWS